MKKRILPALLALCMVMSLLPVSVFAAGECTCTYTKDGEQATCSLGDKCTKDTCEAAKNGGTCKSDCPTCKEEAKEPTKDPEKDPESAKKCETEGCVLEEHSGPHKYACACELKTDCSHHETEKCPEKVDDPKALCSSCAAAKELADKKAADDKAKEDLAKRDCKAAEGETAKVPGTKDCQNKEHQEGCPASCAEADGIENCTLTAGHTENHKGTDCTEDTRCPAAAGTHKEKCPSWEAGKDKEETKDGVTTVTRSAQASKDFTVEADCACAEKSAHTEDGLHKDVVVSGKHEAKAKVTVTVYKVYTFEVVKDKDGKEDTAATEKNRVVAEKAAIAKMEEPKAAPEGVTPICAYCEAALAAEKVAADAKAEAACKMTIDCKASKHKDDCLSQCSMDKDCENTAGDANAHKMLYRVMKTTLKAINVEGDAENGYTYKIDSTGKPVADEDFTSFEKAQGYIKDQKKIGTVSDKKADIYEFEIRTIHCPKSGGVDSTVLTVAADGTTTETKPAEEVKAPEKAEDLADVDGTEWFAEELTSLIEKGIFTGSLDDGKYSFKAKDEMSTDMLVVLVSRVLDKGLNTTGANWAAEATAWAAEEGLTEGVEAGKVTRKDVILVLWRAAGSPKSEQSLEKFVDAEGLEGDQLTAMKWAVETGIVKGNDKNELNGDAVIIRSEMVAVIARFDGVVNAD